MNTFGFRSNQSKEKRWNGLFRIISSEYGDGTKTYTPQYIKSFIHKDEYDSLNDTMRHEWHDMSEPLESTMDAIAICQTAYENHIGKSLINASIYME